MQNKITFYCKQVLIALDQLINALCGGWADETISSRAWRLHVGKSTSYPKYLIDFIFFFDKNHCQESYESERLRLQSPPELRGE